MKRFVKGVCLMGTVALLAVSCNKKQTTDSMVYSVRMDAQEQEFGHEQGLWDNEEPSRMYIQSYVVNFETGDELMLFNLDEATPANSEFATYTVQEGGTGSGVTLANLANLDGTGISDDIIDAKYAFYPAANVNTSNVTTNNTATFTLATTQQYTKVGDVVVPAGDLYMASKIDKAASGAVQNDQFHLRNICGVLELKFYSPSGKTLESIELTNGGEMNITGDVSLYIPAVDPGQLTLALGNNDAAAIAEIKEQLQYYVENAGNTITLTGINETLATTAAEANSFYFVLRPQALMEGFTAVLNFSDSSSKTITSTRNNMIKPNTFKQFTALNAD